MEITPRVKRKILFLYWYRWDSLVAPEVIVVAIPNKEPGKDNRFRDYSPTLVRDYYSESGGGLLF